ncbi:uncharacterized protein LOC131319963 isoform X3 [Rhododendron vialii]|uniref:uncharacterized protein LOC131319963 isoform X3 n=1 Tax=Rhododendron vialii TaxID=182163 RepID=UPI00265E37A4|nr:uncharacterized protein LOC131319963 isoform X3 [Rhododendron vialii]
MLSLSREGPGISYGLNLALAGRGVIVKDKAFRNLNSSELQQKGATFVERLSGLPVHIRGNVLGGSSEISKAHFSKLLKQVTTHISSISNIFVHDGAIGTSPKCCANVRVISDDPSAVLSLSSILRRNATRAVSHDSCPLTIYVATSISPSAADILGLGAKGNNGFIAADVERSSLILCGKAFTDAKGTKEALAALSGPIICARGGLPLSARLLFAGDSVILFFAPEDTIQSCLDQLVSGDIGVVLSSEGASPLFESGNSEGLFSSKLPAAIMFVSSDSSGTIPFASKLSPGQAAYHFLAGYQNGKFLPGYNKGPSAFDPLDLAKAFLAKIRISLSWYNHAYRKIFHYSNSKVDISKQSTRASYPADFKNYQRNSYFEIPDNHLCFSCGGGTTGDAYLVLINSSENLYHVCASTRLVLLPIYNRFSHIHIVVTLQKDRHILVIDLKLLDLG